MTKKLVLILMTMSIVGGCGDKNERYIDSKSVALSQFSSCDAINRARVIELESNVMTTGSPSGNAESTPLGDTNVQVSGVDELDTTKADGNIIYRAEMDFDHNDTKIRVIRRSPTAEAKVLQSLTLSDSYPWGIFVSSDRVVALLQYWSGNNSRTKIVSFEKKSDGLLKQVSARSVDGTITTARMIGSMIHFVVNKQMYSIVKGDEQNTSKLSEEMPRTYVSGDNVRIPACRTIWREEAVEAAKNYGLGTVNNLIGILSFDITQDFDAPRGEWIAGNTGSIVFASEKNLFLAGYGWNGVTPIHEFRLATNNSETSYVGSTLVRGYPLNQFSMDEYKNYFRIAFTQDSWLSSSPSSSSLLTFKLGDKHPVRAGELRGLGVNEKIYAVRFMGDRAFVVTFRQIDPLFAIDLKDQENPILKGELKVPGVSNYLHPISDEYLLGIGQSADAGGMVTGMALSLFDVSDLSHPKLAHSIKIGERGTSSEAQYDHHAFRYIDETDQLVIPVRTYDDNYNVEFNGFQIYDVSTTNGFALKGESAVVDESYGPQVGYRSFYSDGIISMLGEKSMVLRESSSPTIDVTQVTW